MTNDDIDKLARDIPRMTMHGPIPAMTTHLLAARLVEVLDRNKELYEAMRIAEDVGVDEGLFDEDERMTERLDAPMTDAGKMSCEIAAESCDATT